MYHLIDVTPFSGGVELGCLRSSVPEHIYRVSPTGADCHWSFVPPDQGDPWLSVTVGGASRDAPGTPDLKHPSSIPPQHNLSVCEPRPSEGQTHRWKRLTDSITFHDQECCIID